MKKLPGESRNGFPPAFDEAQKDTQVLLPSLSILVFYARFSLATLFSRNPRKLTREYFKVFKGSAREGGARLAAGGQKKPTRRWSWRGGVGKKEIRAVCHFIRDTFHPSSFFSSLVHLSFFLSFFLYRNHEFRRRRH